MRAHLYAAAHEDGNSGLSKMQKSEYFQDNLGLRTAPTQYTTDGQPAYGVPEGQSSPSVLRRLVIPGVLRWFVSALCVGGFVLLVQFYEGWVLSPHDKTVFEALLTALSLALGLNIASALKSIALQTRWWLLSHKRRSEKEVRMILNCDSLMELFKLSWTAAGLWTKIMSILWIGLNLVKNNLPCFALKWEIIHRGWLTKQNPGCSNSDCRSRVDHVDGH